MQFYDNDKELQGAYEKMINLTIAMVIAALLCFVMGCALSAKEMNAERDLKSKIKNSYGLIFEEDIEDVKAGRNQQSAIKREGQIEMFAIN